MKSILQDLKIGWRLYRASQHTLLRCIQFAFNSYRFRKEYRKQTPRQIRWNLQQRVAEVLRIKGEE